MIEVVWEFRVGIGREAEFEGLYNSDGAWAELFHNNAKQYQGTTLLRDGQDGTRYLTIDRWNSLESYHNFKQRFADAYAALDKKCEALTESERLIGIFNRV